ncbi:hypothetical protein KO465_03080 [Candidatus Micrarchaeota archaeon]|jgi:hypothetical protein|nr:hypothetical protein [Candidatus Micrarchaeota archaeon]
MNPGAGEELKHLMAGVKSKTSKPEGLDSKDEGLSLNDKSLNYKDKTLDPKPKGDRPKSLDLKDKGSDSKAKGLNSKALGEAVEGANSNRQSIAIWSPKISAVMWYLKKTTPEFSISEEARAILEEGLEKKYPELFQKVKEGLKK